MAKSEAGLTSCEKRPGDACHAMPTADGNNCQAKKLPSAWRRRVRAETCRQAVISLRRGRGGPRPHLVHRVLQRELQRPVTCGADGACFAFARGAQPRTRYSPYHWRLHRALPPELAAGAAPPRCGHPFPPRSPRPCLRPGGVVQLKSAREACARGPGGNAAADDNLRRAFRPF